MAIPIQVRSRFYALRALAVILMALAGLIFIVRPHNSGFRSLALLAILLSVWLGQRSQVVLVRRARGDVRAELPANRSGRVSALAWALTAASLLACVICYFLMYLDQLHGGKEVWPVYAFAAAGLALTITSSYVVMIMFRRT